MAKWYKVEFDLEDANDFSLFEFIDEVKNDMFEGRVKYTSRQIFDLEATMAAYGTTSMGFICKVSACFKFKSESDAVAFKLKFL